jgi:two-component system CheB/CheR fusion protein
MRRVLVIEDNTDAADTLKEALELEKYEVCVAYDALEGIAKARTFQPNVVLCDLGLPTFDGFEVARRFKGDPQLSAIHLVALSGWGRPEDIEAAKRAGFEAHIVKPPSLEAIEQCVARFATQT